MCVSPGVASGRRKNRAADWAKTVLSPRGREHIQCRKRKKEEGYKHRLLLANLVCGIPWCCVRACASDLAPQKQEADEGMVG